MIDVFLYDVPKNTTIFEPTAGAGNFERELIKKGYRVETNNRIDFFKLQCKKYNIILGNPPFTPMKTGYLVFERCFNEFLTEDGRIIFILPWFWLLNATKRMRKYYNHIISIHLLDRNVFKGSRIQTGIFEVSKQIQEKKPKLYLY